MLGPAPASRTTPDAANKTLLNRIADSIDATHLASCELGVNVFPKADHFQNTTFVNGAGEIVTATLIGEIGSANAQTHLGAAPAKVFETLTDTNSKYRPTLGVVVPRGAGSDLADPFTDGMAFVDSIRGADADAEAVEGKAYDINEALVHSGGDARAQPDVIVLRLPQLYALPANTPSAGAAPATPTRKRIVKVADRDAEHEDTAQVAAPSSETGLADNKAIAERSVGDMYSPDLLPDHRGPVFNHVNAKCPQRDIRDVNGDLIAPHEMAAKLLPGTLILAQVSVVTYNMPYHDAPRIRDGVKYYGRKVYQVQAERIKILDAGDGPAFTYPVPALPAPRTPVKRARGAADDTFEKFSPSPESPKKKGRRL